jgi:carboxylesterase type B
MCPRCVLVSALAVAILAAGDAVALSDPVATRSGPVAGEAVGGDGGVRVYRGIPYAAPPVGELRWRPPQPPAAWQGVRDATEFGAPCMQLGRPDRPPMKGQSEDCLYLNVWTAAATADEKRPVMVWIHGGGLNNGTGRANGEAFARSGVVLVAISYRLNVFGFLAHPELSRESKHGVSGNYGFLDQLAALRWVRDNVSAFGGDPDNVTIFGESAGGTSVHVLLASPQSAGLFHRAISQSAWITPSIFNPLRTTDGRTGAEEVGERAGRLFATGDSELSLAELRAMPAERLRDAVLAHRRQLTTDGSKKRVRSTPFPVAIDGCFLFDEPVEVFRAGGQLDVPVIVGFNADEGSLYVVTQGFRSVEAYHAARRETFGVHADRLLELYPATTDDEMRAAVKEYVTDDWYAHGARIMMRGMAGVSSTGFMYYFTRPSPVRPALGAHHAAEIPYVFNTIDRSPKYGDADRELARFMQTYWVNFARTGDPNGEGLPEWPAYELSSELVLDLGDVIRPISKLRKEHLDFWDTIFHEQWPIRGRLTKEE